MNKFVFIFVTIYLIFISSLVYGASESFKNMTYELRVVTEYSSGDKTKITETKTRIFTKGNQKRIEPLQNGNLINSCIIFKDNQIFNLDIDKKTIVRQANSQGFNSNLYGKDLLDDLINRGAKEVAQEKMSDDDVKIYSLLLDKKIAGDRNITQTVWWAEGQPLPQKIVYDGPSGKSTMYYENINIDANVSDDNFIIPSDYEIEDITVQNNSLEN